jgi:hypothetical protein
LSVALAVVVVVVVAVVVAVTCDYYIYMNKFYTCQLRGTLATTIDLSAFCSYNFFFFLPAIANLSSGNGSTTPTTALQPMARGYDKSGSC